MRKVFLNLLVIIAGLFAPSMQTEKEGVAYYILNQDNFDTEIA